MFPDIFTPELEAKVRQNATLVKYCDDPEAFEKLAGQSIDSMITIEKINEFRQRYSHIRVYHACRPANVQSYYKNGIRLRRKREQVDCLRKIFLTGRFPELTEEMLQQSIEKLAPYSDDDEELCVAIDDIFIIEYCGHYLIYGSEYLAALVINLPIENTEQYLSALRKIGKPTFLEINLPNITEYVRDSNLCELIYDMIKLWVYNVAHSRTESCSLDFTFPISKPLPPEHIYSHYHPRKIPDPNMRRKIYNIETGEYEDEQQE